MREFIKLAIILATISSAASFTLALVYDTTREPIAHQQELQKRRAVNAVFPQFSTDNTTRIEMTSMCPEPEDPPGPCQEVFLIRQGTVVQGVAFQVVAQGYGGPIRIMVGATPDPTVSGIIILNHGETPGLGAGISNESFFHQFAGKNLRNTNWALHKKGGDIDQVSGATISSEAVTTAVHHGLQLFDHNRARVQGIGPGAAEGD